MECGLGRYIGLPDHPDIEKLKSVWSLGSQGIEIAGFGLITLDSLHANLGEYQSHSILLLEYKFSKLSRLWSYYNRATSNTTRYYAANNARNDDFTRPIETFWLRTRHGAIRN